MIPWESHRIPHVTKRGLHQSEAGNPIGRMINPLCLAKSTKKEEFNVRWIFFLGGKNHSAMTIRTMKIFRSMDNDVYVN